MQSPFVYLRSAVLALSTVAALGTLPGCYDLILDAVIDDPDLEPGGKLQAAILGQAPLEVVALAKGDPMLIHGASTNLVVAMTCGDDVNGRSASRELLIPGGTISLLISPSSRTQLQIHAGGMSCVATSGQIDVNADRDLAIGGSFSADGVVHGTNTPCSITGTLSGVPNYP